jgi:hypothetical protein
MFYDEHNFVVQSQSKKFYMSTKLLTNISLSIRRCKSSVVTMGTTQKQLNTDGQMYADGSHGHRISMPTAVGKPSA